MSEFEDGVPMPASYRNGRPATYRFRDMEVGQSIYVPSSDAPSGHVAKRAYATGQRTGMKFACRRDDDGIRIWRVE